MASQTPDTHCDCDVIDVGDVQVEEEEAGHTGLALEYLKKVALVKEQPKYNLFDHNFN